MPTPSLRIFISSTSVDLQEHRQAVFDLIMQSGEYAIDMKYFGSRPKDPETVCREAIEQAGHHRLRPILMTSICTGLGLVPMALGIGEGSELQAPLARVVIGGLLTSTLITLVFVPAMYTLFEEGLGALRRRRGQEEPAH